MAAKRSRASIKNINHAGRLVFPKQPQPPSHTPLNPPFANCCAMRIARIAQNKLSTLMAMSRAKRGTIRMVSAAKSSAPMKKRNVAPTNVPRSTPSELPTESTASSTGGGSVFGSNEMSLPMAPAPIQSGTTTRRTKSAMCWNREAEAARESETALIMGNSQGFFGAQRWNNRSRVMHPSAQCDRQLHIPRAW